MTAITVNPFERDHWSPPLVEADPLPWWAKAVREMREAKGLTRIQLSADAECSHNTIAGIEDGTTRPRIDVYERIIRALGAELDVHALPEESP